MKRKLLSSLLGLATLLFVGGTAMAGGIEPLSKEQLQNLTTEEAESRVQVLTERVNEIKDIDFGQLPKEERRELKNEMREIKKEMDFLNNKVTLSVGAVIIIVLLIILIF